MGKNSWEKWMYKAEVYQDLLDKKGVEAAAEYLSRFKSQKMLEAIWRLKKENDKGDADAALAERQYQESLKMRKEMGNESDQHGASDPVQSMLDGREDEQGVS